ncbi:MAG: hypothetical protein ABEJ22_01310 [Haloferacaceae archaeon]
MGEVTRSPSLLSVTLSLVAATVSLVAGAVVGSLGLSASALGVVLVGVGVFRGSRRLLTAGTAGLLVGLVVAGAAGAPPLLLVLGAASAVVSWDVGEHGIGVGEQLGREADTTRVELVHATLSLVVALLTVVVSYGAYRAATGGQPVTALVFLLVGAVALVAALR